MEDDFGLAYRAIVPAPLGWAIMKTNELEDTYSDNEEYATILETDDATRETERRTNKWKKQLLVITIVMTLAL